MKLSVYVSLIVMYTLGLVMGLLWESPPDPVICPPSPVQHVDRPALLELQP